MSTPHDVPSLNPISLAIDGGTTNTRIRIIQGEDLIATKTTMVGVRNVAIAGSNAPLVEAIQAGITELLQSLQLSESDITLACGSGMITSGVGLLEVPHVAAPAGMNDLARNIHDYSLPDSQLPPLKLIPGVKSLSSSASLQSLDEMDIMRGEEAEVFGLLTLCDLDLPVLVLLPGSHTKLVLVNKKRQIVASFTSLAGEFLQLLATQSVLAKSVLWPPPEEPNWHMIQLGRQFAAQHHLMRSSFMVRMADVLSNTSTEACCWLLVGMVTECDLAAIQQWNHWNRTVPLVISAREPTATIYRHCLNELGCQCIVIEQDVRESAAAWGALAICNSENRPSS